jgi:hypothetical protein
VTYEKTAPASASPTTPLSPEPRSSCRRRLALPSPTCDDDGGRLSDGSLGADAPLGPRGGGGGESARGWRVHSEERQAEAEAEAEAEAWRAQRVQASALRRWAAAAAHQVRQP